MGKVEILCEVNSLEDIEITSFLSGTITLGGGDINGNHADGINVIDIMTTDQGHLRVLCDDKDIVGFQEGDKADDPKKGEPSSETSSTFCSHFNHPKELILPLPGVNRLVLCHGKLWCSSRGSIYLEDSEPIGPFILPNNVKPLLHGNEREG